MGDSDDLVRQSKRIDRLEDASIENKRIDRLEEFLNGPFLTFQTTMLESASRLDERTENMEKLLVGRLKAQQKRIEGSEKKIDVLNTRTNRLRGWVWGVSLALAASGVVGATISYLQK